MYTFSSKINYTVFNRNGIVLFMKIFEILDG